MGPEAHMTAPDKSVGPGTRVGEYVLEEKIGEGGFGSVWRAVHHAWPDRVVAVKIPTHRGLIDQLRKEAEIQRTLEALDDRHIVKTLGLDTTHEPPYFVMEFVEGESLRALLKREGRLGLDAALGFAEQVLKALRHAHDAGVVHMDLKPENILIASDGVLKLMDFGLGFRPSPTEVSVLLSGELGEAVEDVGGTLEYMAPEIRRGDDPDPRADLYAFGVILFEMLTGERPQPGDRPRDLNPAVPKRLDRVFSKCYARAEKRYGAVREVLEAIRPLRVPAGAEGEEPVDAGAPAPPRIVPDVPLGMAFVPVGKFTLGAGEKGDRAPAQERFLDAFFLDVLPVTNGEFLAFVRDGGYAKRSLWEDAWDRVEKFTDSTGRPGPRAWKGGRPPRGRERHPVTGVGFHEARAFAAWANKRLPDEEEWEKAARGSTDHAYPWGPAFDAALCNTVESKVGGTSAAGRYRRGASPFGILDLAGNVLEWTTSFFKAYPGNEEENPYFGEFYRVLRGGCWYFKGKAAEVTVRHFLRPDLRLDYVGFRCARDA
jgi:formylglycine-generating enzyme required for sulfatase activity